MEIIFMCGLPRAQVAYWSVTGFQVHCSPSRAEIEDPSAFYCKYLHTHLSPQWRSNVQVRLWWAKHIFRVEEDFFTRSHQPSPAVFMPSESGVFWRRAGPLSSVLWQPKPGNFDGKSGNLQPCHGDKTSRPFYACWRQPNQDMFDGKSCLSATKRRILRQIVMLS